MRAIQFIILSVSIGLFSTAVLAQPSINNIEPNNDYTNGELAISGSGFGTNVNDIIVWFGGVRATSIVSVTENIIKAQIPPGAPNAPITVERIGTGLIGMSNEFFYISHSGSNFNLAQLEVPLKLQEGAIELFDLCGCDFDNDGLTDFATSETTGTAVGLHLNTSTIGTFSFTTSSLNSVTPTTGIGCADLDGDGKTDLYMTRAGSNRNQLYIYRNTSSGVGNISFGSQIAINLLTSNSAVNPYQAVRVVHGDLTGDGKVDLVVTNGNSSEKLLNIIENTSTIGSISFAVPTIFNVPDMTTNSGLSLEDVDNDGNLDLILTRTLAADVYIYRNTGGGGLNFESPLVLSTTAQAVTNVSAIDLDNDGLKEIITSEVFSSNVVIYKNQSMAGSLSFATPVKFIVAEEPWTVKGVDIDGNGLLDLAVASRAETRYSILVNQGGLSFTPFEQVVDMATRNIYAGDVDGDGKPDLAFSSLSIPNGQFSIQVVRNTNCYQPVILNDIPLAICPTQTITLKVADSPGVAFSWTKDAVPIAGSTNTLDVTVSGVYQVTAISEGGSCSTNASVTVNDGTGSIPASPVATNDGPACVGQSFTLMVGAEAGATYSWQGPGGFTSSAQNPVLTGVTESQAGIYYVTVKIGDCLSSTAETNVVVNSVQSFSISTTDATTICAGGTVAFATQNRTGFTYKWLKNGSDTGASSTTFNATTSGIYSAEITDIATNCTVTTNTIEVIVLSMPVASFTLSNPICKGIDASFTNTSSVDAGATVTHTWDFGDGTTINAENATHVFTTAATFNVTLTASYDGITGCSSNVSNNATVVDASSVNITASRNTICADSTVDLTANGTFTSLSWNAGDTTPSITVSTAGVYTVDATDSNGCISSAQFDLAAGLVPVITVTADGESGPVTIAPNTPVQLQATGADSYIWTPADFLSAVNISDPIATPSASITYIISGALIDGCIDTTNISIVIDAVGEVINIKPLKAFSPNSTQDPNWRIESVLNYPDCTLSIFDERGTLILRDLGYNNDWNATYEGIPVPEGVYYYVFSCPTLKPLTGTVLVVR
jgi:gliding motility-associated-like protein